MMKTKTSAPWLPLLLAAVAGCSGGGGYEPAVDAGSEGGAPPLFTEIELAVIRLELGTLPAVPDDPTNGHFSDVAAAALGQEFFFEPRYSQTQTIACATCHIPERGFQDNRSNTSLGIGFTPRHTGTLLNAVYGSAGTLADASAVAESIWQSWDGARDSLWAEALWSAEDPVEMGGTRSRIALLLYDKYRRDYEAVFGPMPALRDGSGNPLAPDDAQPGTASWSALDGAIAGDITRIFVNFGKAIEAYATKIVSRDSRFDQLYREVSAGATRSDKLTADEAEGLKIFVGKGRCISCHRGPNFSDWEFYRTGVAQSGDHVPAEDSGRSGGITRVLDGEFKCSSPWSDRPDKSGCSDQSLILHDSDRNAFKVPTLRSVSTTAPYFHTGAMATLTDVVEFYDRGGDARGGDGGGGDGGDADASSAETDRNVQPLFLSSDEKARLVAFLRALDGAALDPSLITAPALPP